jgi:hypothetical protein
MRLPTKLLGAALGVCACALNFIQDGRAQSQTSPGRDCAGPASSNSISQPCLPPQAASIDVVPLWSKALKSGNEGLSNAVQAISGKPVKEDMRQFLLGVITIERTDEGIKLTRQDNESIVLSPGTAFGERVLNAIDQASVKATKKFGKSVGELVSGLSSVELQDNRILIHRQGPDLVPISLGRQKQEKKLWVKQLKLGDLSFEIAEQSGRQTICHVTGFTAVLDAMDMPIELRDFSRWLNQDGLNVYCVGVKSPIPSPITALLGLPDVLHMRFTEHGRSGKKLESEDGGLKMPRHRHKRHQEPAEETGKSTVDAGDGETVEESSPPKGGEQPQRQ